MSVTEQRSQTWINIGLFTGILSALTYALPQMPFVRGRLHDVLFMSFGPLLCLSAVGMYHFFRRNRDTVSNQITHGALLLGGLSFTYMSTMQASIFRSIRGLYVEGGEVDAEFWQNVLDSVSSAQLGLDYAFDIFVSVATVLLAVQMWQHPKFWRAYSALGVVIGITGLAFNTITFPENSGEQGLLDPGPFFGVWMSCLIIVLWRYRTWIPEPSPG